MEVYNNDFFKFLSSFGLSKSSHQALYQNASQNIKNKNLTGFVDISFINSKEDDMDEQYGLRVSETIKSCINNGFSLKDICVLVRKKKEGVALAEYLTQQGTPIISSETLLVSNSEKIQFILNLLKLFLEPNNNELKLAVLMFLAIFQLPLVF